MNKYWKIILDYVWKLYIEYINLKREFVEF